MEERTDKKVHSSECDSQLMSHGIYTSIEFQSGRNLAHGQETDIWALGTARG